MAGLLADGVVVVRVRAPIRNLLDLVLEGKSVCVFQTAVMVGGLVRRQIVLQFLFLGLCFAEERFDQLPHNALVAHLIAARLCQISQRLSLESFEVRWLITNAE